jgi:hypothetical protein
VILGGAVLNLMIINQLMIIKNIVEIISIIEIELKKNMTSLLNLLTMLLKNITIY